MPRITIFFLLTLIINLSLTICESRWNCWKRVLCLFNSDAPVLHELGLSRSRSVTLGSADLSFGQLRTCSYRSEQEWWKRGQVTGHLRGKMLAASLVHGLFKLGRSKWRSPGREPTLNDARSPGSASLSGLTGLTSQFSVMLVPCQLREERMSKSKREREREREREKKKENEKKREKGCETAVLGWGRGICVQKKEQTCTDVGCRYTYVLTITNVSAHVRVHKENQSDNH